MNLYAFVNKNNEAVNFVESEGPPEFVPEDHVAVMIPEGSTYGYGWIWNEKSFVEPAPKVVVPDKITQVQFRLALSIYNLLSTVESTIDGAGEIEKIYFQHASEVRRDNIILNQMATNLNLSKEQVDEMFIFAATL